MILNGLRVKQGDAAAADTPAVKPTLVLRGVSKHYDSGQGALAALSNVSLEIQAGELTVLMGPSGSGKTTLLSIMGGILRPTAGEVVVCGQDLARMPETGRSGVRLAHVGYVFQSYNLFPTLTARQNVEIALDLRGMKGAARRRRALAVLDQVELAEKANVYPAELSGGQKQRVAIARALAGAPAILLADEPTAALDSVIGRRVIKLLRDVSRLEGCAVVVVTHDSRILEFADRVITIEDGRIASDTPANRQAVAAASLNATMIRRPSLAEVAWTR